MVIKVTLSANAGVCLNIDGLKIWVDALHDEKVPGFSTVAPELFHNLMASSEFSNPDVICVTHRHPDHYSEEMVNRALLNFPNAELLLADSSFDDLFRWEKGGVIITFFRLTHDGAQYADCLHYGILLSVDGKNILLPGDCLLANPELKHGIQGVKIDLALLNFPWLTLKKGETFVIEEMKPQQVVVYHLPFAQDDVNGFRSAAQRSAEKWGDKVRLLMNPLETVTLDI